VSPTRSDQFDAATRLRITSDTANIARVRAAVQAAARRIGFPEADAAAIELAINEAVSNVIRHGYQGRRGQPIDVTLEPVYRPEGAGLQVTIRDHGRQVDPSVIVGRDLEDVRPGGLGTHIMRTVMDEVEYKHREPEGMELRLLKMIAGSPGGAGGTTDSTREASADDK